MYHVTNHEMVGSNGVSLLAPRSEDRKLDPKLDEDFQSTACATIDEPASERHDVDEHRRKFVTCPDNIEDPRLKEALDYIHRHLEDPIGVQELINHVCVSRRWLEYAFRDEVGVTPYQYIRLKRLEHAGELLAAEPMTKVYEVARRAGFSSAKQLTMAFRQHYGMSPRDYRREACLRRSSRHLV